ncbi:hypothetical protein T265_02054 [Opisthorchis viverrini]|uniref:Uncharacterized protein n=1 Tax=Opisthorchis viverrini TaxID=6198 RepID=A0A075A0Q8_OPIVI|nr:hypothetical protein T265_02054 [Opisthorchis viverrini]KER31827.1 hypothetical protein T265_02054 [Opisthorchis viverrini]
MSPEDSERTVLSVSLGRAPALPSSMSVCSPRRRQYSSQSLRIPASMRSSSRRAPIHHRSEDRPLDARKLGHNRSGVEARNRLPPTAKPDDPKLITKPIVVISPCERQPLTDKNKTDPGNLGKSLAPVYQSVNPRIMAKLEDGE